MIKKIYGIMAIILLLTLSACGSKAKDDTSASNQTITSGQDTEVADVAQNDNQEGSSDETTDSPESEGTSQTSDSSSDAGSDTDADTAGETDKSAESSSDEDSQTDSTSSTGSTEPYNDTPIVNGDFSSLTENWTTYVHFDAAGTFEVIDGEAVVYEERDGDEDYSIHTYQGPFRLDPNKIYIVQFDARADIARDLGVIIDNAKYDRHIEEMIRLTNEMTTYTLEVQLPDEPVSLKLLIGEYGEKIIGPNTVYFDNISIFPKE